MGCISSVPESSPERKHVQLRAFKHVFEGLRIAPEEIDVLYGVFDKTDNSRDGFVSGPEFFRLMNLKSTAFTRRIFMLFDRNSNEEVDFGEFVAALWSFLTVSKLSLATLAFHLYDIDGSGLISADEISRLVKELNEDPAFDTSWLDTLDLEAITSSDAVGAAKGKRIGKDTFLQFAIRYPSILFPAIRVQEDMRARIGGQEFWNEVTQRRMPPSATGADDEVVAVKIWVTDIKSRTMRGGALGTALSVLKTGRVSENELAARRELDKMKARHKALFPVTRTFLRQASDLFKTSFRMTKKKKGGGAKVAAEEDGAGKHNSNNKAQAKANVHDANNRIAQVLRQASQSIVGGATARAARKGGGGGALGGAHDVHGNSDGYKRTASTRDRIEATKDKQQAGPGGGGKSRGAGGIGGMVRRASVHLAEALRGKGAATSRKRLQTQNQVRPEG